MEIRLFFKTIFNVKHVLYIEVYLFFIIIIFFTMNYYQYLLSVLMLKIISIFVILCFHMFDKMTIRVIKKKKSKKNKNKNKNKDGHVHVEEEIGRTNIEKCYL